MTQQLLLLDSKQLAGRQDLRDSFDIKTFEAIYKIRYSKIIPRPGFQKRTIFGNLDELADSIEEVGLENPITVDVLKDGTMYLVDGERRILAIGILIKRGNPDFEFIPAYINHPKTTEAQRMRTMYLKNNGTKQFEPFEEGEYFKTYLEIPHEDGRKRRPADIAKELGVSKMHVSSRLSLTSYTDSERLAILDGIISSTAMKELKMAGKTEEEIASAIAEARLKGEKLKVKDAAAFTPDFNDEKADFKTMEVPEQPDAPANTDIPKLTKELLDDVFSDDYNKESDHQEKQSGQEDTSSFMAKPKGSTSSLVTNLSEVSVMVKAMMTIVHKFPFPAEDITAVDNLRTKIDVNLKAAKKMAEAIEL